MLDLQWWPSFIVLRISQNEARVEQTIKKHREGQKNIRLTFIDLENAYDSIPREEIWRSSKERNVPEKYIRLV